MQSSEPKVYNIYNSKLLELAIEELCERTERKDIKSWLRGIFTRYIRTRGTLLRQVVVMDSPALQDIAARLDKADETHPYAWRQGGFEEEWAQKAYAKGELYIFSKITFARRMNRYIHWIDYLETIPEGPISMTPSQLLPKVEAWDKKLAQEKVIASMNVGVKRVYEWDERPEYVVQLVDRTAFKVEGKLMHNCVGGYFGRNGVEVYSLRHPDHDKALVTIEIRTISYKGRGRRGEGPPRRRELVQVEKAYRKTPSEEEMALIREWLFDFTGSHECYDAYDVNSGNDDDDDEDVLDEDDEDDGDVDDGDVDDGDVDDGDSDDDDDEENHLLQVRRKPKRKEELNDEDGEDVLDDQESQRRRRAPTEAELDTEDGVGSPEITDLPRSIRDNY